MKFEHVTPENFEDFKKVRMEGMKPHVEREGLPWQWEYEEWYHRHMFDHGMKFGTLYKVIDDNIVVGYVGVSPTINVGIWLDSKFRGRGIGTKTIQKIFEENPHMRFELDVFKNNPARKLYEKLGFEEYATNDHFIYMQRHRR